VENLYHGSASKLVMHLLGTKKTSKKEAAKIKELLKKLNDAHPK
jgi:predicted transcriptional regulator